MINRVHHGDALEGMKQLENNSVTGVVTDPPYGLSDHSDIRGVLEAWLNDENYQAKGGGFMSRKWDSMVPSPVLWRGVYRVLKPGGFIFVFAGTRSMDLTAISIRLAGFQIKDTLAWHYGSGFPKSMNIGNALNKQDDGNSITDVTKQFDGYGIALKPSFEPILVAMKPVESTYVDNALTYGVAGLNIDAGRIGYQSEADMESATPQGRATAKSGNLAGQHQGGGKSRAEFERPELKGRWPANTVLTHHSDCEYVGEKKVRAWKLGSHSTKGNLGWGSGKDVHYADESGNETVEDWNCHPDCPIRILDKQSGSKKGKIGSNGYWGFQESKGWNQNNTPYYEESIDNQQTDFGGASRFFYTAKASRRERNYGCDDLYWKRDTDSYTGIIQVTKEEWDQLDEKERRYGNTHPTVKPIGLLRWLVRLLRMPQDTLILDPFAGSGSVGVACVVEGVRFTGFDIGGEYCTIANSRIEYAKRHPNDFLNKKEMKQQFSKKKSGGRKTEMDTLF